MGPQEAELFILELLAHNKKMTTAQINNATKENGRRCPDETPRFLMKMKLKGIINGEVSYEHKGWIWSKKD